MQKIPGLFYIYNYCKYSDSVLQFTMTFPDQSSYRPKNINKANDLR